VRKSEELRAEKAALKTRLHDIEAAPTPPESGDEKNYPSHAEGSVDHFLLLEFN
jgi:hypothetical protein